MPDLLAALYRLPSIEADASAPRVRRAMAYEMHEVVHFIGETWNLRWASEAQIAFGGQPVRCFVAINEGQLCGFACYDATFRGFFGPMGVSESQRGSGTGKRLLVTALTAMREAGYAYAAIGDVDDARGFYEKTVDAHVIEGSQPGPYEYDLRVPGASIASSPTLASGGNDRD